MIMRIVNTGSKKGNCYALCSENEILLLDCGCDKKSIQRTINYDISKIVGCLLTHRHSDHSKSCKWLLENRIPVYTNDGTADELNIITREYIGISEKQWIPVGNFNVMQFSVPHDGCPCSGFLISHPEMGKLLYLTDLEYCPYSFKNLKVQHLLVEANYIEDFIRKDSCNYSHQIRGHCSLGTCKGIVEANKTESLRTVTLVHLSEKVCEPSRALSEVKSITGNIIDVNVAVPGLEVRLAK